MKAWLSPLALVALVGATTPAPVEPVVLELFTSQGCSSCPPADRLMAELSRDPALLVMLRPVTYWDRLGWKDTLARPENTALQQAYTRRHIPGGGVYTPQVVVEGARGAVGSSAQEIRTLIAAARRTTGPALVVRAADDGYGIGLAGTIDKPAELVLVALSAAVPVAIGRGENTGQTIIYTNVVREERLLARWTGGRLSVSLPHARLRTAGADRYALLVREPDGGRILAASTLPG